MAAWRRITVSNGGKGMFPHGIPPDLRIRLIQASPTLLVLAVMAGIVVKRCAEVPGLRTFPSGLGMRARERTGGAAPRDTIIVSHEGQRVSAVRASLTSKRRCAEVQGSGRKPVSCSSVE